jgi:hypothetical protein
VVTKGTRALRLLRLAGIGLLLAGILGIVWQYHDIARCSTAQVGAGCGLAMNIEGLGFAGIFAGAILIVASFVLGAFARHDADRP